MKWFFTSQINKTKTTVLIKKRRLLLTIIDRKPFFRVKLFVQSKIYHEHFSFGKSHVWWPFSSAPIFCTHLSVCWALEMGPKSHVCHEIHIRMSYSEMWTIPKSKCKRRNKRQIQALNKYRSNYSEKWPHEIHVQLVQCCFCFGRRQAKTSRHFVRVFYW